MLQCNEHLVLCIALTAATVATYNQTGPIMVQKQIIYSLAHGQKMTQL